MVVVVAVVVVVVLVVPVVLVVIVVLVFLVSVAVVVVAAVPCCCCCCCCRRRLRFWSCLVNISTTTIGLTSIPTILFNVLILSLFLPVLSFMVSPILSLIHLVLE